ncbi:MAG: RNA methyltransferase [Saprospiraceae bacterium]|nr:RNA methyltransferase [Saprospiraceae bacterium]
MLSQNQAKFLAALQIKKYRQKYRNFLVEGDKMVRELLTQQKIAVSALFALERWAQENATLLSAIPEKINLVTASELGKISTLSTPNQVLAVAELPQNSADLNLPAQQLCFYLDGIQDPGNLGSILRVADWFGFPAVYCSPDCVDVYSPKVVQSGMGAIFRVQCLEIELGDLLQQHPDLPVSGAVLEGENVFNATLPRNGLLVIGNEGRGISKETEQRLTRRLSIPKHPAGGAESLNAAIAAGIMAAAFRRE